MRALTIGELESESGTARSTVYYYVRAGLLPPAQKSSPTRALYTDAHVEILEEIRRLKQDGLDIKAIRERLQQRITSASQNGEDLVARQEEEMRRAILRTAAREFARNGYRQTRISDIIADLGITPQTLYGYFPTKRDLFAAAYRESLDVSMSVIEPQLEDEEDLAVHLLWRMVGDYALQAFNPDLLYLSREAAYDDPETTRQLRNAHEHVLSGQGEELRALRGGGDGPPFPDELVNYALYGAFQTMRLRASWDDRFSRSDVMWVNVLLNIAVRRLYDGSIDVAALKRKYGHLIDDLAAVQSPDIFALEASLPQREGSE
ncbi:MAG TPA: MerR family transcriptional regulator [Thermoleophilia bacterium]|nr:MerR family transcriptional regulator [Thermoleophilia bacterium]